MLINVNTAQDIRSATASEPLTLAEEYSMQQSWQTDTDKLTFIVCKALENSQDTNANDISVQPHLHDAPAQMLGDVNLFLSLSDESTVIGELELMIAEKAQHRKGYGRAALLVFLIYILDHERAIVEAFLRGDGGVKEGPSPLFRFHHLAAKIGKENLRSLALFENLGFVKMGEEANYFGEWELRLKGLTAERVEDLIGRWELGPCVELEYKVA
ncbi:MAG: hypothetical protein Q9160_006927 [Pyrenula sp. 1 TL-2023]